MGSRPLFLAVQRGLALVLPLIMVGALAIMVRDLPLSAFHEALDAVFGADWRHLCTSLIEGSFGIASLALLCAFSGTITTLHNQAHDGPFVSPVMGAVVVLSCFFVLTAPTQTLDARHLFSLDRGLLVAIGVATLGSWTLLRLSRIRSLQLPFRAIGNDPVTRDIMTLMPAGILTILLFGLLRELFMAAGISDLYGSLRDRVDVYFTDTDADLGPGLFYVGFSQVLWFLGVHGPNLLFPIEENILVPSGLANLDAVQLGDTPEYVITKSFIDAFARLGGSGSTLCLILAILLASRDAGSRKLCLFAMVPALCNVNEPLLFGIPLVFNPTYLIPFVLTPILQTLAAFGATQLGWLPHTTGTLPWSTPVLISGFASTGAAAGVVMQIANLVLGILLYLPFVGLADRLRESQGKRVLRDLSQAVEGYSLGTSGRGCLDHPGEAGRLAKALAEDLDAALKGQDQLFLEYQPQIDARGDRVYGVEALLRWAHPHYGRIPPPVTVAIAEDMGFIDRLGAFVLNRACAQRAAWRGQVPDGLVVSVNVSPRQLADPWFDRTVVAILARTELSPAQLELEITESTVLLPDSTTLDALRRLRDTGVRVAIDDFGMGHSSLRYLRELPVDTVKIDRSLTTGDPGGVHEQIVRSIADLSRTLGINTILEGVETEAQLSRFQELGCQIFQGYLFSRPLEGTDCLRFIRQYQNHMDAAPPTVASQSDRVETG